MNPDIEKWHMEHLNGFSLAHIAAEYGVEVKEVRTQLRTYRALHKLPAVCKAVPLLGKVS